VPETREIVADRWPELLDLVDDGRSQESKTRKREKKRERKEKKERPALF
jgi:hypothetical protein